MVSALAELVPRGDPDRRDAVGNAADPRAGLVVLVGDLTSRPRIAVTPGLRKCLATEEDSRTADQALALSVVDPVVGAAHVADRREPPLEHAVEDASRPERHVGRRELGEVGEVGRHRRDVDVRVDEAGQDVTTARVEGVDAGVRLQLRADLGDEPVPDPDVAGAPLARNDIEELTAMDEEALGASRHADMHTGSKHRGPLTAGAGGAPAHPPMRAGAP